MQLLKLEYSIPQPLNMTKEPTDACVLNRDVPIVHSDFNLEDMKYKCKMCGSTRDKPLACDWVKLHS